jgi:hypothetical protein
MVKILTATPIALNAGSFPDSPYAFPGLSVPDDPGSMLVASPVVIEAGLYSVFYPGPDTYPGAGNTLSARTATTTTLTGDPA